MRLLSSDLLLTRYFSFILFDLIDSEDLKLLAGSELAPLVLEMARLVKGELPLLLKGVHHLHLDRNSRLLGIQNRTASCLRLIHQRSLN